MPRPVVLISGPEIAAYGFPEPHPFGADRHDAFMAELERSSSQGALTHRQARQATREELELFALERGGEVIGTWRPRTSGRSLALRVQLWTDLRTRARAALDEQAALLAAHRDLRLSGVEVA